MLNLYPKTIKKILSYPNLSDFSPVQKSLKSFDRINWIKSDDFESNQKNNI